MQDASEIKEAQAIEWDYHEEWAQQGSTSDVSDFEFSETGTEVGRLWASEPTLRHLCDAIEISESDYSRSCSDAEEWAQNHTQECDDKRVGEPAASWHYTGARFPTGTTYIRPTTERGCVHVGRSIGGCGPSWNSDNNLDEQPESEQQRQISGSPRLVLESGHTRGSSSPKSTRYRFN